MPSPPAPEPPPEFSPPALLRNPHVQTLLPLLLAARRPPLPPGEPVRFTAPDGEPLVGVAHWQPGRRPAAPAALLVHGVEGNADSHYIRRTAAALIARGWHVVRLDLRGCGAGEPLTPTLLHGGRGDDLAAVLARLAADGLTRFAAVGFSLGGAVLLNLLGEHARVPGLFAAAVVSPLLNPLAVQRHFDGPAGAVYRRYFLAIMARRLRRRAAQFPGRLPAHDYRARTLLEFDDRYTAPLTGFASALDYYRRADPLPRLPAIVTPTLLLHAQDDPMVPFAGLADVRAHAHLHLEYPRHGGHIGFYNPTRGGDGHWALARVLAFLEHARTAGAPPST